MMNDNSSAGSFLDPSDIIKQLNVLPGNSVADFGCGPGYFTIPFAKAVGEEGKVYALDVLEQALESVSSKAKMAGLSNVLAKRVNLEKDGGSKLPEESVDWVVMKDVLFQNRKKDVMIKECFRVLKVGGRCLIIEWKKQDSKMGPEQELRLKVEDLEKLILESGLKIENTLAVGDFHYGLIASK